MQAVGVVVTPRLGTGPPGSSPHIRVDCSRMAVISIFAIDTISTPSTMLIKQSYRDVPTKSGGKMRIYVYEPHVVEYPEARFPGCVVFSEVCYCLSISAMEAC